MMNKRTDGITSLMLATALVAVMGFTACSSSGGSDGSTPASASAISIGTMTKGSVIVNGVTFEDNAARITADDTIKQPADLASGMMVKVRGAVNANGLTGVAEKVEVVNEVSGAIASKGTDTFSVLNQTVLVDGGTVFAGGTTNLTGLNVDDSVEVHGQRDANGTIRATRVEKHAGGVVDEVRGTVSGKTATSFNIGSLPITFDVSTAITPTGATFADGDIVQVHLNGAIATSIKVEDDDAEFRPGEGQHFEVEGFVSGLGSGSFNIDNQQVQTTSSTRFEGGVEGDLVNDMKVEAEGHLAGGVLVATKIAFKDTIRIEANAETAGSANLLGKTVLMTSKTELSSNLTGTSDIGAGDGLRIRGFLNNDGSSITATRVEKQSNPIDPDKNIVRGPVKDINATAKTFTILGITINAGASIARPDDDSGSSSQTMSLDTFFSSLTDGRTIVKARGTFSGNTINANEIELE